MQVILQMILPEYIKPDWSEHSFDAWTKKCQEAQTAETIELLTEVHLNHKHFIFLLIDVFFMPYRLNQHLNFKYLGPIFWES